MIFTNDKVINENHGFLSDMKDFYSQLPIYLFTSYMLSYALNTQIQ